MQVSECKSSLANLMLTMKLWNSKNTSLAENILGFGMWNCVSGPWCPK